MAKIAVALNEALARRKKHGLAGQAASRPVASGPGWSVSDVVCTSGPRDRPFEEQHAGVSIAFVLAGSFQYRSSTRQELMSAGSLLLGNPNQYFECGHEHGEGDRCLSFYYEPEHFESIASNAGFAAANARFPTLRLPALRELSPVFARGCAALSRGDSSPEFWEELSLQVAGQVLDLCADVPAGRYAPPPSAVARVTRVLRAILHGFDTNLDLGTLAQEAGLSRFHFLRTFERITGLTPHQYLIRLRLREAAAQLASEPAKIVDVALGCGFGDVSNFNRAFRAEFGQNPRTHRRLAGQASSGRKT